MVRSNKLTQEIVKVKWNKMPSLKMQALPKRFWPLTKHNQLLTSMCWTMVIITTKIHCTRKILQRVENACIPWFLLQTDFANHHRTEIQTQLRQKKEYESNRNKINSETVGLLSLLGKFPHLKHWAGAVNMLVCKYPLMLSRNCHLSNYPVKQGMNTNWSCCISYMY